MLERKEQVVQLMTGLFQSTNYLCLCLLCKMVTLRNFGSDFVEFGLSSPISSNPGKSTNRR